ncbi:MAG: glycosyltransferase [Brucellaceae bacterium]|jgi:glycosyltransferase involved in cell wall biosynthesis|nr:glycosyltransferase [Brucellaceae bacterium]
MTEENKPLILIMLPTYNRPDLILRTVNSIISQNYQNFKIFIFNDGSVTSYSKLEELISGNERVIYYKSKMNVGINKSRNFMIDYFKKINISKNTYIFTISDDDFLAELSLETIADEISKHSTKNWLCFNCNSLSKHIFSNNDYDKYDEITYKKYMKNYKGDKHFVFKFNAIQNIRYPDKYFKNGFEHIYYHKIRYKIFTIPKTVKNIEYQDDGLSVSPIYKSMGSLNNIAKHIAESPLEPTYYKWLLAYFHPKKIIKKLLTEERYYRIKKGIRLKK